MARPAKLRALASPRLPRGDEPDHLPGGSLLSHEVYRDLVLADQYFGSADGVCFEEVKLLRADWRDVALRRLELTDVHLAGCDLSNSRWSDASLERVELLDCRMTGFGLVTTRVKDVRLKGCLARLAIFEGIAFDTARFESCSLEEANFDGANLTGVVFEDCNLHDATFVGATLTGTDFRRSNLESSRVRPQDLRGAILTPMQALALFQRATGADVREADA